MTAVEALEQMAMEFEQRRAKLIEELKQDQHRALSARYEARQASAVYQEELRARANELRGVVSKLRAQARDLRSEETSRYAAV